jgi:hypothetical protein
MNACHLCAPAPPAELKLREERLREYELKSAEIARTTRARERGGQKTGEKPAQPRV